MNSNTLTFTMWSWFIFGAGLQVPVGSFNLEVATLKQKLESKEQDFTELLLKYQMSVSERDLMEEQLSVDERKS